MYNIVGGYDMDKIGIVEIVRGIIFFTAVGFLFFIIWIATGDPFYPTP